jgi:hypothetical protein
MNTLRIKINSLVIPALILVISVHATAAESGRNQEYKVKAAFIYNFIKFVDWPKEKIADSNSITIGILGKNPFGKAFEPLKDKRLREKKVIVKPFKGFEEAKQTGEEIETLRRCHVLFVCRSETKYLNEIIESVRDHNVLTIGDTKDFLESGGIINFLMEDEKVRFEIHNAAAKKARLDIRSKLLRLAKRTIDGHSLLLNDDRIVARLQP